MRLFSKLCVLLFCITLFYSCTADDINEDSQLETTDEIFLDGGDNTIDSDEGEDETPKETKDD